MSITLEELRNNLDHWVNVARTEDVTVTESGRPTIKLTSTEGKTAAAVKDMESLFDSIPADITVEDARAERLSRI